MQKMQEGLIDGRERVGFLRAANNAMAEPRGIVEADEIRSLPSRKGAGKPDGQPRKRDRKTGKRRL